jgi:hypothetical protein
MDFLKKKDSAPTRRKFLSGAAAATAGTLAFPMIAKAAKRNRAAVKSGRLKLYEGEVGYHRRALA